MTFPWARSPVAARSIVLPGLVMIPTARDWLSRLVSSAAVVFAFLLAPGYPLDAQTTLIVSDYGGGGNLSLFPVSVNGTPGTPTTVPSVAGGGFSAGEGAACLAGSTSQIFVADNGPSIYTYNLSTKAPTLFATVSTGPAPLFTALSLSKDGLTLYAAGDNGYIYGFDTSTAKQIPGSPFGGGTEAWHDIAADSSGNVYATNFQDTSQGVAEFFGPGFASSNPSFIPNSGKNLAGMAFDGSGNLWVSDFGTNKTNNSTRPGVYEYDPTGKPLASFISSQFVNPLGLALGPGDGNIYIANFTSPTGTIGTISKIQVPLNPVLNDVSDTSTYITNAGENPKYLLFQQNCTPAAPDGYIEVCKLSATTNPVPANGIYPFTVSGSAFSTSASPLKVPVGECSGPILVTPPSATITELPALASISTLPR